MIDDGVVKYNLDFTSKEVDIKQEVKKIEMVRERLFSLGLIGAYDNGIGYGNISVRYKNSSKFAITATQTGHLPTLGVSEYSLVDDIDFSSFKTIASGLNKPSSECITHGSIYTLDKNIGAVIHVHNELLWNFMLKNDYLSTNDTPYGTPEMVQDVLDIYKNINALENNLFVMKGHFEGIVSFGENLKDAEFKLYELLNKVIQSAT